MYIFFYTAILLWDLFLWFTYPMRVQILTSLTEGFLIQQKIGNHLNAHVDHKLNKLWNTVMRSAKSPLNGNKTVLSILYGISLKIYGKMNKRHRTGCIIYVLFKK